jgi:hypothetical protein
MLTHHSIIRPREGSTVNRLVSGTAVAAFAMLASLPLTPAHAAVTLQVSDIDPQPGQTLTINGDGDDCPETAGVPGTFSVRLRYTQPAGTTADVVATGDVETNGVFTTTVTLPENAVADAAASVTATATCAGVVQDSNTVSLAVLYRTGAVSLSASSVTAGGSVTVTAANCYGGEYLIVYGEAGGDPNDFESGASGTPAADRSVSVALTIPATTAAGSYDVYALCPGTEYETQTLAVRSATVTTASAAATVEATIGGGMIADLAATPIAKAPTAISGNASFTG